MRAVVMNGAGGPEVLQIQDRPSPLPGDGELLIRVQAAGINRPDIAQRKGVYPAPPGVVADIPGLEISGVVQTCGPAANGWKPGDRVCALVSGGGYAEQVCVPEGQCLPLPKGWSFEEAATLPETVFTVWHNVFQRGHLQRGEHFLVHGGSGGIGITAVQLAHAFGARVLATAGSDEKCAAVEALGADRCVNYKKEDFEASFREEGADLILDMIGGDYTPKNIRLLRPDGRLVFINASQGARAEINAHYLMTNRLTITGSTLRVRDRAFKTALAREVERMVWPLLEQGKVKPVLYAKFPLDKAADAHRLMETSHHIGKIVLAME